MLANFFNTRAHHLKQQVTRLEQENAELRRRLEQKTGELSRRISKLKDEKLIADSLLQDLIGSLTDIQATATTALNTEENYEEIDES